MFIPDKNIKVIGFWDKMMCSLQIHTNISEEPTESFTFKKRLLLEDGGSRILQYNHTYLPNYTATYSRCLIFTILGCQACKQICNCFSGTMRKWLLTEPDLTCNQEYPKYSKSPAKCTADRDPKTAVNCMLKPPQVVIAKNSTCKSMHTN